MRRLDSLLVPRWTPRWALRTPLGVASIGLLASGLALWVACSPRPETATQNEPPTGASEAAAEPEPAKAVEPEPAGAAALAKADGVDDDDDGDLAIDPDEPEAEADPLGPVSDEIRERFTNLPRDPKPDELIRNSHYWVSNELNQDLWHEHIADLGGAYLGVGTDQNYLLAAWAKSDFMVVVDFDAAIADLHQVYLLFFDESETYEDFFMRWSPDREEEGLALIDETLGARPDHDKIRKSYKIARQLVWARLRRVRKIYPARGIATFVSDQEQYDHIRTLARNGRIYALRGDFTANETMVALGRAMNEEGLSFNVIYLSNVEQYVDYSPQWRRNFIGLPVGEKSVVIRTLGWGAFGFAPEEEYHYNVQPAPKFQEWLATSRVSNLPRMLHFRTRTDVQGLSLLDGDVRPSKNPPAVAE